MIIYLFILMEKVFFSRKKCFKSSNFMFYDEKMIHQLRAVRIFKFCVHIFFRFSTDIKSIILHPSLLKWRQQQYIFHVFCLSLFRQKALRVTVNPCSYLCNRLSTVEPCYHVDGLQTVLKYKSAVITVADCHFKWNCSKVTSVCL